MIKDEQTKEVFIDGHWFNSVDDYVEHLLNQADKFWEEKIDNE